MSHRESAPAREQRVGQTSAPRGDLFSHPPQAEALDQRRAPTGERVDWRAMPFSAGQRRDITVDDQPVPGHRRQPAGFLDRRHPERR
jgi:hypothetical protein